MRREKNNFRYAVFIFAVIAVVISILIGFFISRGINSSNQNKFAEQMSKLSKELNESDTVSTKIGKSVEQAEKDEEQQGFEVPIINIKENTENKTKSSKETNETVKNKTNNKNENKVKEKSEEKPENTIETNSKSEDSNNNEEKIEFEAPIKGEIIREFAKDSLVFSNTLQEWVTHNGIDIKADKTSVVKSSAKGTVSAIKNDPRYGLTVIITHDNGYQTIYSNLLTTEFVVKGENVEKGQSIGTIGNSASFEIEDEYHLHFELLKDNEYLNPTEFMQF